MIDRKAWLGVLGIFAVLAGCSSDSKGGDALRGAQDQNSDDSFAGAGGAAGVGSASQSTGGGSGTAGAAGMGFSSGGSGFSNAAGAGGAGGSFAPGFSAGDEMAQPMPDNSTEPHTDVGVNPFVVVEHDPFSTFAADVDTASYDLMRRDLTAGLVPVADGVRVEDYVNYFNYDY